MQPNQPLFDTITTIATVTDIGILNGMLANTNYGNISHAYTTGNSYGSIHHLNGYPYNISGGLVGLNSRGRITNSYAIGSSNGGYSGELVGWNSVGTIANFYAIGDSACTRYECISGGLVGYNSYGRIIDSYTTGSSTCTGSGCDNSGLVGTNSFGTITASYRVQTTGNTLGTAITLPNLRTATSFSDWLNPPWNFGTTSQLPQHESSTGIPFCPGAITYSDTSCRW